jgi:MoaA/NifB/PqqE/SkfB family radical SAM enzyme
MEIIDLDKSCTIKWRLTDACNYHCSYCIRRPFITDQPSGLLDMKECEDAIPQICRISEELKEINQKNVKIDLIGGEVAIYPRLNKILDRLYQCDAIGSVNITTNLFNTVEYYLDLFSVADSYNKSLSMTASFHIEFAKLDEFIEKSKAINAKYHPKFKCETVVTPINTQYQEFIDLCEANDIYYMAEEDLFNQNYRGQKLSNKKTAPRYLVKDDFGNEEYFNTRNEYLKKYGVNGYCIPSRGGKCTRDMNYVYIEKNVVFRCTDQVPIEKFHVSKERRTCVRDSCTLCGHMSISIPKRSTIAKQESVTNETQKPTKKKSYLDECPRVDRL